MRVHSIPRRIGAALMAGALVGLMATSALAAGQHFNEKFEFEDVTFPDGTAGEIYASSKLNNHGDQFTYCGYVDTAFQSLGEFGSGEFSSADADVVLDFCLEHYDDRS